MKALVLNGSPAIEGIYETIQTEVLERLKRLQYQSQSYFLKEKTIHACQACYWCWTKTPGVCIIKDDAQEIVKLTVQSSVLIYITPIIFGGYGSDLKKALDRFLPAISPLFTTIDGEIHHKKRYQHYPSLLCIGISSSPDEEKEIIFRNLVHRNALNLHSPAFSVGVVQENDSRTAISNKLDQVFDVLKGNS